MVIRIGHVGLRALSGRMRKGVVVDVNDASGPGRTMGPSSWVRSICERGESG